MSVSLLHIDVNKNPSFTTAILAPLIPGCPLFLVIPSFTNYVIIIMSELEDLIVIMSLTFSRIKDILESNDTH